VEYSANPLNCITKTLLGADPIVSTLISPVAQEKYPAVVAVVAAADIVMVVASNAVIVVPAGIPVPCTGAPMIALEVLDTAVITFDPMALVPVAAKMPIISFEKADITPLYAVAALIGVEVLAAIAPKETQPFVLILMLVNAWPLKLKVNGMATAV
jgi:hypothetical protein